MVGKGVRSRVRERSRRRGRLRLLRGIGRIAIRLLRVRGIGVWLNLRRGVGLLGVCLVP